MKKNCDNCATCPVMKIEEKLRIIYDWANNFPQFENCGKAFKGEEGVLCFTARFARTVNWKEVEKVYKEHKEEMDDYVSKVKKIREVKCQ